jgi:hypothetical protein
VNEDVRLRFLFYVLVGMTREWTSYFGEVTMRYVIIVVTLCGLLSLAACASDWSAWSSIGDDVSLSYRR